MTDEVTADTVSEETGAEVTEESVQPVSTDIASDEELQSIIDEGLSTRDEDDVEEDEEESEDTEEESEEFEEEDETGTEDDEEDETVDEDDLDDENEEDAEEDTNETKDDSQIITEAERTHLGSLQTRMQQLKDAVIKQKKIVAEAKETGDGIAFAEADKQLTQLTEAYNQTAYSELKYRNDLNVKAQVKPWKTQKEDVRSVLIMDGVKPEQVDQILNEIHGYGTEFVVMLHKRARVERAAYTIAQHSTQLRTQLDAYKKKYGELTESDLAGTKATKKSKGKANKVKVKVKRNQDTVDKIKSSLNTMGASSSKTTSKKRVSSKDIATMSDEDLNAYLKERGLG